MKTFTFEQLAQDIQEKLVDENRAKFADSNSVFIAEMFADSRKAFENIFNLSSYGTHCTMLDEDLYGVRLSTWLHNNIYDELVKGKYYSLGQSKGFKSRNSKIIMEKSAVLTGTASDDSFVKRLFDFMAKPCPKTTLNDLIYDCLESGRVDQERWNDANYSYDEGIKEFILNNGDEYTIDGEMIYEYDEVA